MIYGSLSNHQETQESSCEWSELRHPLPRRGVPSSSWLFLRHWLNVQPWKGKIKLLPLSCPAGHIPKAQFMSRTHTAVAQTPAFHARSRSRKVQGEHVNKILSKLWEMHKIITGKKNYLQIEPFKWNVSSHCAGHWFIKKGRGKNWMFQVVFTERNWAVPKLLLIWFAEYPLPSGDLLKLFSFKLMWRGQCK